MKIITINGIQISSNYSVIDICKEEDFIDLIKSDYGEERIIFKWVNKKNIPVYHCYVHNDVIVYAGKIKGWI